jgi:DNA-binding transcriptional LysR family regulator
LSNNGFRPSLELLQTFVTLIQNDGDASWAARKLGINQPSMSKRLAHLRHGAERQKPWLVRKGKVWKVTDEGNRVYKVALDILDRYQAMTQFVGDGIPSPQIHIACGQMAADGLVRRALQLFRSAKEGKYRSTSLSLSTMLGNHAVAGIANGELDLAVASLSKDAIHEIARRPLYSEPIERVPLALVCAHDTSYSKMIADLPDGAAPLSILAEVPLILTDSKHAPRNALDAAIHRQPGLGPRLNIRMQTGGWHTIVNFVSDKEGVGVVAYSAVRDKLDRLIVRRLDPEQCDPIESRLICRRLNVANARENDPDILDLSDEAKAFRVALREAADAGEDAAKAN